MSSEDTRTLEFNQYWKSDQTPYITYADLESLIKKIYGCNKNFERSSTTKVGEHISCGYSVSTIWTCDGIENQRWKLHEKVLWMLQNAHNKDN